MERSDILLDAVEALIRKRYLIVGVTLLVFVAAVVSSFFMDYTYDADVVLAVTDFRANGELGALLPPAYTSKDYERLLTSNAVVGETLDRLAAKKFWAGTPPRLGVFREALSVEIHTVDQTTRPITYSPFIELHVRDTSTERAKTIVATWAEIAVETAGKSNYIRIGLAAKTVSSQADAYRAKLDAFMQQLAQEKGEWNTDVLTSQLTACVTQMTALQEQLVAFQQEVAGGKEELTSIRAQLATEPQVLTVAKAPSDDVYWLRDTQSAKPGDTLEKLSSRTMKTEVINDAYTALKLAENTTMQKVARAEAQIESTNDALASLTEHRDQLQQQLAQHTFQQQELQTQASIYENVFKSVDEMRLFTDTIAQMAGATQQGGEQAVGLNRITQEIYPVRATGMTSKRMRIALATMAAFLATVMYVLMKHWSGPVIRVIEQDLSEKS